MRTQRYLIWSAGLGLIVLGVFGLYLSDEVAHGWWQGTFQALGVGLLIGGLVDVLVISYLDLMTRTEAQRRNELKARVISALTSDHMGRQEWATHVLQNSPEIMDSEVEAAFEVMLAPQLEVYENLESSDLSTEPDDKSSGEAPQLARSRWIGRLRHGALSIIRSIAHPRFRFHADANSYREASRADGAARTRER